MYITDMKWINYVNLKRKTKNSETITKEVFWNDEQISAVVVERKNL